VKTTSIKPTLPPVVIANEGEMETKGDKEESSLSVGAIVGIAVGSIFVLAVGIGFTVDYIRVSKKKRNLQLNPPTSNTRNISSASPRQEVVFNNPFFLNRPLPALPTNLASLTEDANRTSSRPTTGELSPSYLNPVDNLEVNLSYNPMDFSLEGYGGENVPGSQQSYPDSEKPHLSHQPATILDPVCKSEDKQGEGASNRQRVYADLIDSVEPQSSYQPVLIPNHVRRNEGSQDEKVSERQRVYTDLIDGVEPDSSYQPTSIPKHVSKSGDSQNENVPRRQRLYTALADRVEPHSSYQPVEILNPAYKSILVRKGPKSEAVAEPSDRVRPPGSTSDSFDYLSVYEPSDTHSSSS
jgi:hypothetical protein